MTQFESARVLLQEGDTITSKLGMLFKDPFVEGKGQIVHRVKYLGKGGWRILGEKREFVDMEKVEK